MFTKPIKWKKIGRILTPQLDLFWNQTHMSLPTVEVLDDKNINIYFGGRDHLNRSRVGVATIDLSNPINSGKIISKPVLGLGDLGTFDDNGVMPCSFIQDGSERLLYYVGWNPRATTRYSFYSGLAIGNLEELEFQRYSRAPILERTNVEPFVNASPMVIRDGDLWRMYYVSGEGWINPDRPKYNIKYAHSRNGKDWVREGHVCIDFGSPGEHALARPSVIRDGNIYRMWFGYKGADYDLQHNYRIGYAESADGINFIRNDKLANIDVSLDGWDDEMITYPHVFCANSRYWMLYNGNNYGLSGIGLAVGEVVGGGE
ncbi:hypothetical protein ICN35_08700 [Polynucleobacter sp. es-GGE-1]|uniref:hypothetical protein n=1 Tax=Polynucleobacter sp. es-GGE-1 TaxID=1819724 RepID=UPI001C0E2123|nr:hypothetical protein [Polynucleobacter sp. es-GGE-1]MBU3635537.1 hypothetical protein [Polynucleobacter sp. es-GGE-1]